MGNTTHNDAENAELRARIDQLEYILGHVAWLTNGAAGPCLPQGEVFAFLHGTLTAIGDDEMEPPSRRYSASCYCGWTEHRATKAEAETLTAPHVAEVHAEFASLFPQVAADVHDYTKGAAA